MKCSRCQYENPPGSNFCLGCGTRLGATCGACGNLEQDAAEVDVADGQEPR